ncbi:MAG: glycosyl transferase, partial [Candidatus Komeilibacteria bacterium CG_4_9_14_3_um_filter_37_5]
DLEYHPQDLLIMIKEVDQYQRAVVYGSRRLGDKSHYSYLTYLWGANLITWLTNILYRQKLTDVETCYKLIRIDLLKQMNIVSHNYVWENEVTAKLAKQGVKIVEVPISYSPRSKEEGKKINWRHGLEALWATIRFRF